jgi:hypothetical protein
MACTLPTPQQVSLAVAAPNGVPDCSTSAIAIAVKLLARLGNWGIEKLVRRSKTQHDDTTLSPLSPLLTVTLELVRKNEKSDRLT